MKIFFAKGIWMIPLYAAALIVVCLVVLAVSRIFEWHDRARYAGQLQRAHRYRSF